VGDPDTTNHEGVVVSTDGVALPGTLSLPPSPIGLVVFAHGSGSSRFSPRNRFVAGMLNEAGLATLLFDLLTPDEGNDRRNVFDIEFLAARLAGAAVWAGEARSTAELAIGYFGSSTGGGAALWASTEPTGPVAAVVARGGRPDLAGPRLPLVTAPTLLVVGERDEVVLDLNRQALAQMRCERRLEVVAGATHLFEEPGTLEAAAGHAAAWFATHLRGG
jgi:putative phosphoribosyl transferase